MRKMVLAVAALAVGVVYASQGYAQNLLANPGFEDPTVDMGSAVGQWFRFDSGAAGNSSESTVMPHGGQRHIALDVIGASQYAGVFQTLTIPVSPGQIATFSGWHKAVGTDLATHEIKLEWAGAPQDRLDVLNIGTDYEPFSYTKTAPAGTTGLTATYAISTFGANQGDSTTYIDDFSLTIVPEPATAGLMSLGLLALVRRRK